MSKTATIRTPVEPEFKAEVELILKKLGFSVNEAIDLFLHSVRDRQKLPFKEDVPNSATRKAFKMSDENKGITHYESVDDMFEKLGIS